MKSPEKHPHYFTKAQIEQNLLNISKENGKEALFFCDVGELLNVVNPLYWGPQKYTGDKTIKLTNLLNRDDKEHIAFTQANILKNDDNPSRLITEASYYFDTDYKRFIVRTREEEVFRAFRTVEGCWPHSKLARVEKDKESYLNYQLSTANNNPQYVAVVAQSSDILKKKMDLAKRNGIHGYLFVTKELENNRTPTLKGAVVETHDIFPIKAQNYSILLYGYYLDPKNIEEDLVNIASHHQIKLTQEKTFGASNLTHQTHTTDQKKLTDNNNEMETKAITSTSTDQNDNVKPRENSTSTNKLTDNNNETETKTIASTSTDPNDNVKLRENSTSNLTDNNNEVEAKTTTLTDQNDSIKPRENSTATDNLSDSKTSKTVALISANQVNITLDNLTGSKVEKTIAFIVADQNNLSLENLTGSKVTKAMACVTANQNSNVNSNETSLASDQVTKTAPAVSLATSDNGFFSHKNETLDTVIADVTKGNTI